jgi:hypothetical protein
MLSFVGLVLLIDCTSKIIILSDETRNVLKWFITIFYPIVALYVLTISPSIKDTEFDYIRPPKRAKFNAFFFRYFFQFTAILLLPSLLSFWLNMPRYILSPLRVAVCVIYPATAVIFFWIAIKGRNKNSEHNKPIEADRE